VNRPFRGCLVRTALYSCFGFLLAFSGCEKAPEETATPTVGAKTNALPQEASAPNAVVAPVETNSVFRVDDPNTRDPFFPQSKRNAEPAPAAVSEGKTTAAVRVDPVSLLNLQGILGSGTERIALLNNVMVEPGRAALISVNDGSGETKLKVRCRSISKNSVVLEVEGRAEPIELRVTRGR